VFNPDLRQARLEANVTRAAAAHAGRWAARCLVVRGRGRDTRTSAAGRVRGSAGRVRDAPKAARRPHGWRAGTRRIPSSRRCRRRPSGRA
jgi:hypothetical protein